MAEPLLPITQAMYELGLREVEHPRYASPRRPVVIRVVSLPARDDVWAVSRETTAMTLRVVETYWESHYRGARGRDYTTGLFRTFPVFDGWRCLNPVVAEEEMPQ